MILLGIHRASLSQDQMIGFYTTRLTSPTVKMDDLELGLLEQLTEAVLDEIVVDKTIRSEDLCDWHRRWMGNIYEWAGRRACA